MPRMDLHAAAVSTTSNGSRRNGFQGNTFAFMSSRQLMKCFLPTPSAEPPQAHTSLILAFYYRNQTGLYFDFAAQPALSEPARLPLEVVDTALELEYHLTWKKSLASSSLRILAQGWNFLQYRLPNPIRIS